MREKKTKRNRMRTGRSLNLILWFTFSIFAFAITLLYAFVQNILIHRQYCELAVETLTDAGEQMRQIVKDAGNAPFLPRRLYTVANNHGVRLCVLDGSGNSIFPDFTEQTDYPEKAELLAELLNGKDCVVFEEGSDFSYGTTVLIDGTEYYLYLSTPAEMLSKNVGEFRWMSIVTGLFAVVLAFIASGFVAMLITKPVTEVTERAKALARGNYDLNFKKDYYCGEINELSEVLDHARTEISKADRMQKDLIANVSHDFKTPLTMIKAYASMIREISGEDKEKRDAHAQIIIDETDRLAALVGDVLDLSKLQAGLSLDNKTVFNLSDEVYRIAGRFDYLKETGGYTIETEIEDEIYTLAVRERIEQVLYNLIGNAVNYTGEEKRVGIKLYRKGEGARFEVVDSGKGIPAEEIDTIWDRYYRSNKTHKRPVQGTGLGLSIVKNILVIQGCPFGVISEVGKGSCFWVEFPAPEQKAAEPEKKKKSRKRADRLDAGKTE